MGGHGRRTGDTVPGEDESEQRQRLPALDLMEGGLFAHEKSVLSLAVDSDW